jgi:hypothetical protein
LHAGDRLFFIAVELVTAANHLKGGRAVAHGMGVFYVRDIFAFHNEPFMTEGKEKRLIRYIM